MFTAGCGIYLFKVLNSDPYYFWFTVIISYIISYTVIIIKTCSEADFQESERTNWFVGARGWSPDTIIHCIR